MDEQRLGGEPVANGAAGTPPFKLGHGRDSTRGNACERGESGCVSAEFDEARDATRRTRLANERTYLAWWRTGLTSIAVAIGIGRIVPGVENVTRWPYQVVGAGFGMLGVAFIAVGYARVRIVERALARGEFPRLD